MGSKFYSRFSLRVTLWRYDKVIGIAIIEPYEFKALCKDWLDGEKGQSFSYRRSKYSYGK